MVATTETKKILILDTYYPDFLKTFPSLTGTYEEELAKLLSRGFGTADFYSRNLKNLGWEVRDVIANYEPLQLLWAKENGEDHRDRYGILMSQIRNFQPDIVFYQDLSLLDFRPIAGDYLMAGQCSCPLPHERDIRKFDILFTSLPHYIDKFKALGVRAEYLPLAFEHTLLDRIPPQERDIDVSFVGGVGASLHWKAGTKALEVLAEAIGERFHWYGYGLDRLSTDSPLRKCYRGEAWGLDMYRIYGRSKIVVNRHGEVSQGYANNLRMYEATGMGACLVADARSAEFAGLDLPSYGNASGLPLLVEVLEAGVLPIADLARKGQTRTLENHTYAHRMKRVSEVLSECLQATTA